MNSRERQPEDPLVTLHDPLLAMDIRKLAQQARDAHDSETVAMTSSTAAIHRFLKTL